MRAGPAVLCLVLGCATSTSGPGPSPPVAPSSSAPTPTAAASADPDPPAEPTPQGDPNPQVDLEPGAALELPAAPAPDPRRHLARPPDGFVDLAAHSPTIQLDIRYHTADNFTGAPLPGYGAPGAWLLGDAAAALGEVQRGLAVEGYGLRVYDAYRPARGSQAMVAWARRSGQIDLVNNGYIARQSNHNRGNTVDLTLVDLATGAPVDMGTAWDTLSDRSHTKNATGAVLQRRMLLVDAMRSQGWVNYWKEWWHFTWQPDAKPPHRNIPYGCFEDPDESFSVPAAWSDSQFEPPASWPEDAVCGGTTTPM